MPTTSSGRGGVSGPGASRPVAEGVRVTPAAVPDDWREGQALKIKLSDGRHTRIEQQSDAIIKHVTTKAHVRSDCAAGACERLSSRRSVSSCFSLGRAARARLAL